MRIRLETEHLSLGIVVLKTRAGRPKAILAKLRRGKGKTEELTMKLNLFLQFSVLL